MIQHLTSASGIPVREACSTLDVSPSGFYAHHNKDQRPRRCEDRVLAVAVQSAFEHSHNTCHNTYGSPRLVRALQRQGLHTSKTRVRPLMQSQGLCPRQKRRVRVKTTRLNPHLPVAPHMPVAPHLLLDAPPCQQPGERFYSDITYIPTQEGWLYLAATVDG